jgi:surfeit locus 1 family protein
MAALAVFTKSFLPHYTRRSRSHELQAICAGSPVLKLRGRAFHPGWSASIAAAIAITIAAALGTWQLRRAEEKLALQERFDDRGRGAALQVSARTIDARAVEFSRVDARGEFVPRHTILLDNRVQNGVVGYQVLTPLRIEGSELCVLVNRGWVAAASRREVLPKFSTAAGMRTISGVAVVPSRKFFELGRGAGPATDQGPVWQHLDFERFARSTRLPLQPFVIQQTSDAEDGLKRVWERPDTGVNIHRGYAFQWYALAILVLVLYVTLNLKRIVTQAPRQD